MALNDLSFSVHRRAPWGAGIFFVLACALVGLGVATGASGPAFAAILPGTIALALLWSRPAEIEGHVTDDGIALERPPMIIPFDAIRGVQALFKTEGSVPISFPIKVYHDRGILTIPEAPDINSRAIHEALTRRVAPGGSRAINAKLASYLERHESNFGPERVWTFRATPRRGRDVHRPRRAMAVGLAILATSIAWLFVAGSKGPGEANNAWWGFAGLGLMVGLFTAAIGWAAGQPPRVLGIKNWQTSSLVITPVGLALIQGDIQGELFWDQLRDVKFKEKRGSFRLSNDANLYGIALIVEGARIVIPDFYDRPLPMIHEKIVGYWKPERLRMTTDL